MKDAFSTPIVLWLLALGIGLLFLVRELIRLSGSIRAIRPQRRPAPRDLDQIPETDRGIRLLPMQDVVAAPNRWNADFRSFQARILTADEPAPIPRFGPERAAPWRLLDHVAVISLFIGRDGRYWSDREIAQQLEAVRSAAHWTQQQASRWRVSLRLDLADTYFTTLLDDDPGPEGIALLPEGSRMGLFDSSVKSFGPALMSRAAATVGFQDAVDLATRVNDRLAARQHVWLIHLRCRGRSYAVPVDLTPLDGLCVAVCYAEFASFPEPMSLFQHPAPATIAHEMLHLFGATDKYNVSLNHFQPGTVSPLDIMRLGHHRLSRLRVDPLTAAEIGWVQS
jgi:hypothetical protein